MNDLVVIADDNSPFRCTHESQNGVRCPYVVEPGYGFCPRHSKKQIRANNKLTANRYKLAFCQDKLDGDVVRSDIKSLRNEIATCQLLTQQILNICKCEEEILQYSHHIMTLVNSTASLSLAMTKIETDTHSLLDKGILFDMVEVIVLSSERYIRHQYQDKPEYASKIIISFTDHLMTRVALAMGTDSKVTVKSDLSDPVLRLKHWDIHLKAYYQDPQINNLRHEIALARVVLQCVVNQCGTPAQVIHEYARIIGGVETIRRLCLTANFIDKAVGNLLDRSTVISLADAFSRDLAVVVPEDFMPELVETLNHEFGKILDDDDFDNTTTVETFSLDSLNSLGPSLPEPSTVVDTSTGIPI